MASSDLSGDHWFYLTCNSVFNWLQVWFWGEIANAKLWWLLIDIKVSCWRSFLGPLCNSFINMQQTNLVAIFLCMQLSLEDVDDLVLSRQKKVPKRYEDGHESTYSYSTSPRDMYKQLYYEVIDSAISCIQDRFSADLQSYAILVEILLNLSKAKILKARSKICEQSKHTMMILTFYSYKHSWVCYILYAIQSRSAP